MKKRNGWIIFLISLAVVYSIAFLGVLFNDAGAWYESVKPSITPPNYIFPIVWNIIFFLVALSFSLAWINAKRNKKKLVTFFSINLFLNLLWSFLFFFLKNPVASFYELILLEFSIILMISATYKADKLSSYLLYPYLIWVAFAGVLNWIIAF